MQFKLINKIKETDEIVSFYFEIENHNKFKFKAGQYVCLDLPKLNYKDQRGATRPFTIASSPTENEIRITTRIRQESGYKKTLNELENGEIITARGPFGSFILPCHNFSSTAKHCFLAGGIGITPFRSMIKYHTDKNSKIPILLIYSNSNQNFIFKNEFDNWLKRNNFLKIHYHDSSLLGHLDDIKLLQILKTNNVQLITFWVVGSPSFVNSMEEILNKLKISEENIKTEKFSGY